MQKVKLPREVAEAIEYLKANEFSDFAIVGMLYEKRSTTLKEVVVINSYLIQEEGQLNKDALMTALVNGYEVEETPEEKLRNYYESMKNNYEHAAPHSDDVRNLGFEMHGVTKTLGILGIQIKGVNC